MRAVVLVGGEGTRLRPLTLTTPKQMLPIVEHPMIERVLSHLADYGIDDAVLSLGYRPDAFINAYPDGTVAGIRISYAVEPTPLDTAGAIRFAADHVGIEDTFVVVNGDVLTDLDISALIAFHHDHGSEATISLTPVDDPSVFGVVPTDANGKVEAFIEKPPRDEIPTNLINAGTYVLEPAVLDRIPEGRRVSIERDTFPQLVEDGSLYAQGSEVYWIDTGTPDAYLRAHADLLLGRRTGPPAPDAVEDGSLGVGVWRIGAVEVHSDSVTRSLIGQGAQVNGATVDESVIGHGAIVEEGASVKGSVLLPGARIAASASVEGSIIGPDATIGQRCVIQPLSVIGADAVTASGTVVDGGRVPAEV
ncbi:MAG: sugar phosphate nucleotidyltransferase [Acidimicrobiales bacterium]